MTEDILAKIRKILAKAEDLAATPEEAETYTAKAAELVAKYGIDRALLAKADPESDVVGDKVVVLDPPYALDKAGLLGSVAQQLRCRCVRRVDYAGGGKRISLHLFGYESDLLRVEVLFTSLLLQATTALGRTPVPYGEHAAAFRRSWLAGFTASIARRLAQAEASAEHDASRAEQQTTGRPAGAASVELVLADRSRAVSDAVADRYPRLGSAQGRSLTGTGGRAGWAAGQRADLGRGSRVRARQPGRISP